MSYRDEVIAKVQGELYPSFKRLENFQEGLAWMILRAKGVDRFSWTPKPITKNWTSPSKPATQRKEARPRLLPLSSSSQGPNTGMCI